MYQLVCANCQREGKLACKACLLVLYCGTECQRSHWNAHKKDCKSKLIRDVLRPSWVLEHRVPLFIGGPSIMSFGGQKYLWGNIPAIDILQLDKNEGSGYTDDVHLLFAASGDLRNVVKTLVSVPESSANRFSFTINDRDFDIVSRNAILLLVAFVAESDLQAIDGMIHLWYSAMISGNIKELLHGPVRKLVEDVCSKISSKAPGTMHGKTWRFSPSSLRLVLTKEQWFSLLACFSVPETLSSDRAQQIRTSTTMAHERRDHRERALFKCQPIHRLCATRFREDGMLLPLGQSRAPFNHPNPTLFQSEEWPMKDSADPLDGWALADIAGFSYGPATNDVYGKMHRYLNKLFADFYRRLRSLSVDLRLFNVDARKLNDHLEDGTFARVEVSNISDNWCLGAASTLQHLGRFLQPASINPHATLLTLFMNAVDEEVTETEKIQMAETEIKEVLRYMPLIEMPQSPYDPSFYMRDAARELVQDNDKYFERYMKENSFEAMEQLFGIVVKQRHTIIDKWPLRLKKRPRDEGAQAEFRRLVESAHTGVERYVEWKRVA